MSASRKVTIRLTKRALQDLNRIEDASAAEWGRRTALKCIADIEAGIQRIQEFPGLIVQLPEFHEGFSFYRVNKHVLVCDIVKNDIIVVALLHASQDIPNRLAELEPRLIVEAEMLRRKCDRGK